MENDDLDTPPGGKPVGLRSGGVVKIRCTKCGGIAARLDRSQAPTPGGKVQRTSAPCAACGETVSWMVKREDA
jgi:hypothetical protein